MSRENTFSLTIMVIIMALLAIFVGYLLGNWLIQMVTGDTSDTHQVVQKEIIKEEVVEDEETNIENNSSEYSSDAMESGQELEQKQNAVEQQLKGDVFVVQVGAFKNYNNALNLKNDLETKGFQVIITDNSPHKVQLGATTDRKEAEEIEKKVESLGYNAFITH